MSAVGLGIATLRRAEDQSPSHRWEDLGPTLPPRQHVLENISLE